MATHAVSRDAGYGLLHLGFKVGKVCGVATHAVGGDAGYGLLKTDSQFSDDLFIMCYLSKM